METDPSAQVGLTGKARAGRRAIMSSPARAPSPRAHERRPMTLPAILEIYSVGVLTGFLLGILAPDLLHVFFPPQNPQA